MPSLGSISLTQSLQCPSQQTSTILSEEHCVPKTGIQWHIFLFSGLATIVFERKSCEGSPAMP